MSRAELADAVNRYLWETTGTRHHLDAHAIARYERGAVRWPSAHFRSGLRAVLTVATDAELGFQPTPRGNTHGQHASNHHSAQLHLVNSEQRLPIPRTSDESIGFAGAPEFAHRNQPIDRRERRRTMLAAYRVAHGYSQETLAARLGVGPSTVGRWERGLSVPQPRVRSILGAVLNVELDELEELLRPDEQTEDNGPVEPNQDTSETEETTEDDAALVLRRLLDVYDQPDDGPIRSDAELEVAVRAVMGWRLNADYSRLLDFLPTLVPELTRAMLLAEGSRHTKLAELLMQAYRAADAIACKRGWSDLSGRTIQVLQWAADTAGDDISHAVASYVRTETFFVNGHFNAGLRMLQRAADRLCPGQDELSAAAYGALHMRAAITAARAKCPPSAWGHLAEAKDIAQRLEEGVFSGTAFGTNSVRIHEVSLALDLHSPNNALAAAAGWIPSSQLPAERRSHFFVDVARAHLSVDRFDAVLEPLDTAFAIAPEHIRTHPQVRDILSELMEWSPDDVRHFTAQTGLGFGDQDS